MEKFKLTIKDVVYIITIVISILSTYYIQKGRIDALEANIKNHNLELIEYKLDQLNKQLDKILNAVQ